MKNQIIFLASVVVALALSVGCGKDENNLPTDGLVGHYTFDGNTLNQAENKPANTDGENHGATFTTDRNGDSNRAIHFDGDKSYVSIPHTEAYNFGKTGDFSVSFWVRPTAVQLEPASEDANTILAKWPDNGDVGHPFRFRFRNQDSKVRAGDIINSRWTGTCRDNVESSSYGQNTADGQYHHIVFVKQGSRLFFYQDGQLRSEDNDVPLSSTCDTRNTAPVLIGVRATGGKDAFLGDFDDLRIYNRALSEAEIKLLYEE